MNTYVKEITEFSQILMQEMKKFAPNKTNLGNKHGITGVQLLSLRFVNHNNNCKTSDIADFLNVTPSDATRIIDILANKELIQRLNDEKDRRIIRIILTEKGKKIFKEINKEQIKKFSNILEKMEKKDAETLLRGMKAFSKAIQEK